MEFPFDPKELKLSTENQDNVSVTILSFCYNLT